MNGLYLVIVSALVFVLAYRFYGASSPLKY